MKYGVRFFQKLNVVKAIDRLQRKEVGHGGGRVTIKSDNQFKGTRRKTNNPPFGHSQSILRASQPVTKSLMGGGDRVSPTSVSLIPTLRANTGKGTKTKADGMDDADRAGNLEVLPFPNSSRRSSSSSSSSSSFSALQCMVAWAQPLTPCCYRVDLLAGWRGEEAYSPPPPLSFPPPPRSKYFLKKVLPHASSSSTLYLVFSSFSSVGASFYHRMSLSLPLSLPLFLLHNFLRLIADRLPPSFVYFFFHTV